MPVPGNPLQVSPRPTTSTESARRRAGGGAVPPWSRAFWRIDDGRVNAQSARAPRRRLQSICLTDRGAPETRVGAQLLACCVAAL